jgi:Mg2+ and Co2+ transporter CorA
MHVPGTCVEAQNLPTTKRAHQRKILGGFWWALGAMVTIATFLGALFWRKRYLARTGSH